MGCEVYSEVYSSEQTIQSVKREVWNLRVCFVVSRSQVVVPIKGPLYFEFGG